MKMQLCGRQVCAVVRVALSEDFVVVFKISKCVRVCVCVCARVVEDVYVSDGRDGGSEGGCRQKDVCWGTSSVLAF